MLEQNEKYIKYLGKMKRPIPGQSLTNDPNNPLPFEGAPEFTKKKDALEEIFTNMTREDIYVPMLEAVGKGTPIMDMTQMVLYEGFKQGKWNPDLFLMLVEPTAYMIMALSERAGVDYVIDREGGEEPETKMEQKVQEISSGLKTGKVQKGDLPADIEKKIENMPTESLVQRRQAEEPQVDMPVDEGLVTRRA